MAGVVALGFQMLNGCNSLNAAMYHVFRILMCYVTFIITFNHLTNT